MIVAYREADRFTIFREGWPFAEWTGEANVDHWECTSVAGSALAWKEFGIRAPIFGSDESRVRLREPSSKLCSLGRMWT